MLTRRVAKIAKGEASLSKLRVRADGELVHVRGTVAASATLPTTLGGPPGVFRRVRFALGTTLCFFHEAAVDFDVVDEGGEHLPVQVASARLLLPELLWRQVDPAAHYELVETIPEDISGRITRAKERFLGVPSGDRLGNEWMLRPGDVVDVVGEKSRVPDFTQTERLHREMPTRAVLRSGKALPLVVSPVRPVL
jgi:hypothetical protein